MSALVKQETFSMEGLEDVKKMARALMATPHYSKLGEGGIFAIISMANSIGANVIQCLNGGMYLINGRIELDGQMMMTLIREAGHSVTCGKKCDDTIAVMHGKRKDNNDTWSESFSMQDAKRAGLLGRGVWSKYPKDMLKWRALSRLARFLFPDIIKGCYVQGEISDAPPLDATINMSLQEQYAQEIHNPVESVNIIPENVQITAEDAKKLNELIGEDNEYRKTLLDFLNKHYKVDSIDKMPVDILERVLQRINKNIEEREVQNVCTG